MKRLLACTIIASLILLPQFAKEGHVAQLLYIINAAREGLQYFGDVIGVYRDTHIFSDNELAKCGVLYINGDKADVDARLNQITPVIASAVLWDSDNKYHFDSEMSPEGVIVSNPIEVYQIEGDNKWYQLTTDFKFPINVEDLTAEEKQLLETVDLSHPAVDSFIRKVVKDLTTQDGNDIEIKELRNQVP